MLGGDMTAKSPGIRVFISSTYLDNKMRRGLVRDAIERAGMIAVGMETFEASDRPTVRECQQRAADCDVFVGIVAHRYGWEPPGQEPGQEKSITWLEYEAARAAGRSCLMFEIDPELPIAKADMDAPPDTWTKQARLDQFKTLFASRQMPALFQENTLHGAVIDALTKWRERERGEDKPVTPPGDADGPQSSFGELEKYRAAILEEHGTIAINGFKTRLRVPIDLKELYIPLRGMIDLRGSGESCFADATDAERKLRAGARAEVGHDDVALTDAFRRAKELHRKGLVILGDPGSGKTTHLKRLLIWCFDKGPASLGLDANLVPVFLPLRRLEAPETTIDRFIEGQIDAQLGLAPGFGQRLLARGGLLLLFDGLDEVADPTRRAAVARWIEKVFTAHPTCVPVVTCRFAGYGVQGADRSEVRLNAKFLELHVRPLDPEQRDTFVRNWYRIVETGLATDQTKALQRAQEQADALIAALGTRDFRTTRVAEMISNPLLLANLCLVHRDHGAMPRGRGRLYDECVEVLLECWREAKRLPTNVTADQGRRALQPAAAWLHEVNGRTRASAVELAPVLEPALKAVRWTGGDATAFLRTVRDESGLLTGWGPDQFGFMHLGFQEYLTACELRRRALEPGGDAAAVYAELAGHFGDSWWQEVLLLLVGMGNPSLFEPLLRAMVSRAAFADASALRGMLLEEAAEVSPAPFVELLAQAPARDQGLWQRQRVALEMLEQMGAKDALSVLEKKLARHPDPQIRIWLERRRIVARLDGMIVTEKGGVELLPIPGGTFMMGSPKSEVGRFDDEGPQHEVTVSPFLLGRYPVTNEEYGRFLADNPQVKPPQFWADRKLNQARQPVVGVSWDDAAAFAAWAGGRLPTEAEWEYACRAGTTTATYAGDLKDTVKDPVLDDIAWYSANSGGALPVVGQKKANAWGLHDMLGTVWEWCGDCWGPYQDGPVTDPSGARSDDVRQRVVRGGSWDSYARDARSAVRGRCVPGARYDDLGFRPARGRLEQQEKAGRAEGARGPVEASGAQPTSGPRATGAGAG
jgi:formylglycine-generating enzyme required for sulfatase activity